MDTRLTQLPEVLSKPSQLEFHQDDVGSYPDTYSWITALDLSVEAFMNTSRKIMLCVTLYMKRAATNDKDGFSLYSRGNKDTSTTYERMLVALDVFSRPGFNIVIFLFGKGQNENFFRDCIRMRDSQGVVGPGGMWVIEFPPVVQSWMGDGDIPILAIPDGVVPVKLTNYRLRSIPISINEENQQGHIGYNYSVEVTHVSMLEVGCGNDFCDALGMYQGGKLAKFCSCFGLNKRKNGISILMDLVLTSADGKHKFGVRHHTSKRFTKFFMKHEKIAIGVSAMQFSERRAKLEFRDTVMDLVEYVNGGGVSSKYPVTGNVSITDRAARSGWTYHGWSRGSKIKDQSVDESQLPKNVEKRMVVNSELNHHITYLVPTSMDLLDKLEEIRYDSGKLVSVPTTGNGGGSAGNAVPATNGTPGTPNNTVPTTEGTPGTPDSTVTNAEGTPGTPDSTVANAEGTPGTANITVPVINNMTAGHATSMPAGASKSGKRNAKKNVDGIADGKGKIPTLVSPKKSSEGSGAQPKGGDTRKHAKITIESSPRIGSTSKKKNEQEGEYV